MTEAEAKGDAVEATALEKKIARQIEYYFGDANLKKDRFLQLQIREDNGWVPLETMIKFNRLKVMTTDFAVILGALKKSPNGLMEISEDQLKIRRSVDKPLPEETASYWMSVRARSVYCKGFPLDASLDTMQDFMDQFGECIHIKQRRDAAKKFKGSIFAIYDTKESAKKFVEAEDVKLDGNEMIRMAKDDYFKMKTEERKTKREDDKKKKIEEREEKEKCQVEAIQSEFDDFERGCILHFSGVNEQTSREDLKELFGDHGTIQWVDYERGLKEELFGDHGTIQWVDYERGLKEGTIRFSEETKAQEVLDKTKAATEGALQIRGSELTLRVLEGEEEELHWQKVFEDKSRARFKKQQGRKGRKQKWYEKRAERGGNRDRDDRGKGRKTKFDSDDEEENGGVDASAKSEEKKPEATPAQAESPDKGVKRSAEGGNAEAEPATKKERTEDS